MDIVISARNVLKRRRCLEAPGLKSLSLEIKPVRKKRRIPPRGKTITSPPCYINSLPDELVIHIIAQLDVAKPAEMRALTALAISCRRMYHLVNDKPTLEYLAKTIGGVAMYPAVIWTPVRLQTLSLLDSEKRLAMNVIWGGWVNIVESEDAWSQRTFRNNPICNFDVLEEGVIAVMMLDGLEYTKPNHALFKTFGDLTIICMCASALIYQEVFLRKWFAVMPGLRVGEGRRIFAGVLRYVFLTKGPSVALSLLLDPSKAVEEVHSNITDKKFQEYLQNGQNFLIVVKEAPQPFQPQTTWSMGNFLVMEEAEGFDGEDEPLNVRMDLATEDAMTSILKKWEANGRRVPSYLGDFTPGDGRSDVWNCLRAWQSGIKLM